MGSYSCLFGLVHLQYEHGQFTGSEPLLGQHMVKQRLADSGRGKAGGMVCRVFDDGDLILGSFHREHALVHPVHPC